MNRTAIIIFLAVAAALTTGCTDEKNKEKESRDKIMDAKLFTRLNPLQSGIVFENHLEESDSLNILTYQYLYNGGGVAAGDIDNDGLPDICFTGNMVSCRLYHNKGNFKFEDITAKAGLITTGWCTGVSMADVNGDGLLDIYICRSNPLLPKAERSNFLFINDGNLHFTERGKEFNVDNEGGYSLHGIFLDYNKDANIDLYLVNHATDFDLKIPLNSVVLQRVDSFITHRLLKNNGDDSFSDVSSVAGVFTNLQVFGQSATVSDLNDDNWPDIYVCNDFDQPDRLLINNRNGTYSNKIHESIRHMSRFSMGSDIGDINNDGFPDIITLDMLPEDNYRQKTLFSPLNYDKQMFYLKIGYGLQLMQNCLQLNNGNGTFSEIAELAGIARTDWSWAALLADYNLDGTSDLYVTNGYLRDFTNLDYVMYRAEQMRKEKGVMNRSLNMVLGMPVTHLKNYSYSNNGNLTFTNTSAVWGLDDDGFSNGAAYADFDNDGDLDLVVNNLNDTAYLYQNNARTKTGNNFLSVGLNGYGKNLFGIGAKVKLTSAAGSQYAQMYPVHGYESSVDYKIIFGLGADTLVSALEITWPDDRTQLIENISVNKHLIINHSEASANNSNAKQPMAEKLFIETSAKHKINFTHKENEFIDFKREPLLPHKHSQNGPGIAVADINADGRDDFFIGGAAGSSGVLFLQQQDETFAASSSQPWQGDAAQEDMGALFFDADNDNDMDLYVVSGGSEESGLSAFYQDRLYRNDGRGNFSKDTKALPVITISGSCIAAADYDADGDLDLFRGSRIIPGVYPYQPKSFILRNNGGKFTDVTSQVCPLLQNAGLVTAALWSDFSNDGKPDLIVTGEWMPVYFLRNVQGQLVMHRDSITTEHTRGWWNSIIGNDFDNDGDIDYVAGNFGNNTRIKATHSTPASIYFKDFDGNTTLDAVTCYYFNNGISYPVSSRDDMTDQVRMLKKRLLRFADYAGKTMDQIFTAEEMEGASKLNCYTMQTCYIENKGGATFAFKPLAVQAQISPVFGIMADDFNGDGDADILLTGNSYATEISSGREDAGNGLLLAGNGAGEFKPVPMQQTAWYTPGDAKALAAVYLSRSGKWLLLVSNNNGKLQAFETLSGTGKSVVPEIGSHEYKINWNDNGTKRVKEFYYGSGYLSASSRKYILKANASSVEITNFRANKRIAKSN